MAEMDDVQALYSQLGADEKDLFMNRVMAARDELAARRAEETERGAERGVKSRERFEGYDRSRIARERREIADLKNPEPMAPTPRDDDDDEVRRFNPLFYRDVDRFLARRRPEDSIARALMDAIQDDRERYPGDRHYYAREAPVLEHFVARHGGGRLRIQEGYYDTTVEVLVNIDSNTPTLAVATLAKGSNYTGFVEYVGMPNASRMGQPYTVTGADTTLSQPGATIYPDEVFGISGISLDLIGFRMKLDPGGAGYPYGLSPLQAQVVSGGLEFTDENGILLPRDFFEKHTGRCILPKLLQGAVVQFQWSDIGAGDNSDTKTIHVCDFSDIELGHGMKHVGTTSGGARTLDFPGLYFWTLNQSEDVPRDRGGKGLFNLNIAQQVPAALPFAPIYIGNSAARVAPLQIGMYIRATVHGIGIWDEGRPRFERETNWLARTVESVRAAMAPGR
jgi:hypothetical protein